jgi:beta-glucoside operon transcriptional antiterminator
MSMKREAAPASATVAHKVLNNNVVISVDSSGQERVLMGRGLGFQLQPEQAIDPDKVEKTFVLDRGGDSDHARQLLATVPYEIVEAVTKAIEDAERSLGRSLGRRLPLAVIDHIQFVVERLHDGVRMPTASMPELRVLHPQEFAVATAMARSVGASLDIALPDEEAVFLTMHLLNATRDEPNGTAALLFRRVQHVIGTVERGLGVHLDPDSADYARFILHIQFLLQRLVANSMLRGADTSFFEYAKHSYPRSYAIATDVKAYVAAATGSDLTDEELLYVIVHVERLATQMSSSETG